MGRSRRFATSPGVSLVGGRVGMGFSCQLPEQQALPGHSRHDAGHLNLRIGATQVVTAYELVDVPLQVLGADLVEGSGISPLLSSAQKDSMPLVCAWPLTYSPTE